MKRLVKDKGWVSPKCKMLAMVHNGKMWNADFTEQRNVPCPPTESNSNFETFDPIDEDTWPDQPSAKDKDTEN